MTEPHYNQPLPTTVTQKPGIAAIIVTHNPPGDLLARLAAVARETGLVIIVDNASGEATQAALDMAREIAGQPQHTEHRITGRIDIIRNRENKGLAAALNQGIARARELNAAWVLLLDHDSEPMPGMVMRMLQTYAEQPMQETIALVAPEIRDENTPVATRYVLPRGKFLFHRAPLTTPWNDQVLSVITSGSLIKATVFDRAGVMPEHFFIDYIDHAYCLRLKSMGYRLLLVKDAVLRHRLGEKTTHHLGPITITTPHHSAARRFYIFRNRVWVWKRYAATFPNFVLHDMLAAKLDAFRILFFEQEKLAKFKAIIRGMVAGLKKEPQ